MSVCIYLFLLKYAIYISAVLVLSHFVYKIYIFSFSFSAQNLFYRIKLQKL